MKAGDLRHLRYVKPDKSRITFNELAKQYQRIHGPEWRRLSFRGHFD